MHLLLLIIVTVSIPTAWADVLEGRVVGVADGDTITLLDSNHQQHKIRIGGCPVVHLRLSVLGKLPWAGRPAAACTPSRPTGARVGSHKPACPLRSRQCVLLP